MRRSVDYGLKRQRMVNEQLRSRGITDDRVLKAMGTIPRERFVNEKQRGRAYLDRALSIEEGQTISQPWIVAYMSQSLELTGSERVLEVGTGSGYGAAVLGLLASQVWTLEIREALTIEASSRLAELGLDNVHVLRRDGTGGLREQAPFDGISITATTREQPESLLEQLAENGRLICPITMSDADWLVRYRRKDGKTPRETLVPCRFVPLVGSLKLEEEQSPPNPNENERQ